ncbi:PQQ-binding-like beta-propeller repeat protein [Rhodopirellula sp. MGV]|uniref:outer membrane protein assembly factor BamB family protein n=1 Tax=Rhodopirellula sp. MGV TaxID=2023130 RepID=UPI000B96A594|nr:PQQ-binding-like beta-propeller repeat protein [Rhodopirellula sp. MGV]OYP34890.1 serine/threonine protein kinase [Rhodopirellula sp. MGV]PNY38213.1 serine/threonine protein kinase [Rhodopirellula baltica]
MRKNELSAFSMIVAAFVLGSITAAATSGCKPPTAVPRAASDNATSDNATAQSDVAASENVTGDNITTVSATASETPIAAATEPAASEPEATIAAKPADESAKPAEDTATTLVSEASSPEDVLSSGGDWPQWGGSRFKNNTPGVTGLPQEWNIGKFDRRSGEWDKSKAENIAWYANLGSQTYGNPVVADGQVYVGTNNGAGHLKRYPPQVDLGCLLAFSEKDGSFLWQHSSEKLITGRVHDWPLQGICCAPLVEGKRLWFVTNRGEVRCLDTEGYYDGEDDGPVTAETARITDIALASDAGKAAMAGLGEGTLSDSVLEALENAGETSEGDVTVETVTAGSAWTATGNFNGVDRTLSIKKAGPNVSIFKKLGIHDKRDADTIWIFNMMDQLNTSQHNMCSCSVTSYGDYLFVNTSNGLDESHINLPSPDAPTFICLNKNTGELLWQDSSPGTNILHGQWSSPAVAVLGGVPQVLFAGGDGWLYSFKADGGQDGKGELLWKFDANPKESKWVLGGEGTRNNIIATPVIYNDLVYVAVGQDPEHGEGEGHFWCIDPTKRGNVSPQLAMKVEGEGRVEIPHKRIQAVEAEKGEIAVDNPNSAALWHYSMSDINEDGEIDFEEEMHRTIGTAAIKDDLIYVTDFSGLLHCLDARGENGQAKVYFTYDMLAQSWGSPLIADGHVYVGDEDGDVAVFQFGSQYNEPMDEINMGSSVYSTPIAANGRIYISTKDKLFAIEAEEK